MGQGFRSDILRDLYNAALKQGWRPDESRKSGDYGLLGDVAPEPVAGAVATPGPSNARFRTHVIAAE